MRDLAHMIAAFRGTPIVFAGVDANEHDRWEFSLAKARSELGYVPILSGAAGHRIAAEDHPVKIAVLSDIHSNCFALRL